MQSVRAKVEAREINAVLLLDKPAGITSNRALQTAKRLFNAAKAGHCGTLDPFATGLLPICFGEATKFSRFALDSEKTYAATLRLGETTSTGDRDGEVSSRAPVNVGPSEVERVIAGFVGEQKQTPPMFSALQKNGVRLYALARQGVEVERAPRCITISRIRVISFDDRDLEIEVSSSKGAYIRVLAHDIGEALGCGAHLKALRRTQVGTLTLDSAHTLEAAQALSDSCLLPLDHLTRDLPQLSLDEGAAMRLRYGQPLANGAAAGVYRCYTQEGQIFLGVGSVDLSGTLKAARLLSEKALASQPIT